MVEVLVWLLVSIPRDYRAGPVVVVERFKTEQQCKHVLSNVENDSVRNKCIQANILVPK